MEITRCCPITRKTATIDIPNLTENQLERWENGESIQNAMPHIPAPLREFIKTGIAPQTWEDTFGKFK
jgi:hypothetical protein